MKRSVPRYFGNEPRGRDAFYSNEYEEHNTVAPNFDRLLRNSYEETVLAVFNYEKETRRIGRRPLRSVTNTKHEIGRFILELVIYVIRLGDDSFNIDQFKLCYDKNL